MSIVVTSVHTPPSATNVSRACTDLIKSMEGCELTAYLDKIANPHVWTIGFGDTLGVHQGMKITQEQAEEGLMGRLAREFVPGVLKALGGSPVTQNQLDAMVSLSWNIGVGGFTGSHVCSYHRAGDYAAAADAFFAWNKAGGKVVSGLTRRRGVERTMYLSSGAPTVEAPHSEASTVSPKPAPETFTGPIVAIQEVLVNAGAYSKAWVDGKFGPKTKDALNKVLVQAGQKAI